MGNSTSKPERPSQARGKKKSRVAQEPETPGFASAGQAATPSELSPS